MTDIEMRGINDPIRTLEQARADIAKAAEEKSRRQQFSEASPEEKLKLCTMWVERIPEDIRKGVE